MAATLGPGRKLCVHAYGIPYVKRGNEISSGCRTTLNDAFMMTARRTPGWTTQSSREVGTRERVCLKSFSWELGIPVRIFTFKGNKLSWHMAHVPLVQPCRPFIRVEIPWHTRGHARTRGTRKEMICQGGTGAKTQTDSPYPVTILSTNLSSRGEVGTAREGGFLSQVARIHPWTFTTFIFSRPAEASMLSFSEHQV